MLSVGLCDSRGCDFQAFEVFLEFVAQINEAVFFAGLYRRKIHVFETQVFAPELEPFFPVRVACRLSDLPLSQPLLYFRLLTLKVLLYRDACFLPSLSDYFLSFGLLCLDCDVLWVSQPLCLLELLSVLSVSLLHGLSALLGHVLGLLKLFDLCGSPLQNHDH